MRELSAKRKLVISLFFIFFLLLAAEFVAFIGYSLKNGDMFSWSDMQSARSEVIHGDPEEKLRHSIDKKKQEPEDAAKRNRIREIIHPYLGFVFDKNRPDCSEYGFIDRRVIDNPTAPLTEKTADNYIVGIFGGSFAYGTSLSSSEGYIIDQLKTLPPLRDKEIIVHTLSIGGYKQPQQLIALSYFLSLGAHFDLILNIDGFNEVALPPYENIPKKVNPFFPRMWWMRVGRINNEDMLLRLAKIELVKEQRKSTAELFSAAPLRYSVIGNIFWQFHDRSAELKITDMEKDFTRLKVEENRKLPYVATGPAYDFANDAELYRDIAEVWSRSSRQMHNISRANGIDYFHFLQPNQYVKDSKPMTAEERKIAWRDGHGYKAGVEKGYPQLLEAGSALREDGIPFYDLTMMFAGNTEILYRDACCHLNEEGYNRIIDRIVQEIRARYDRGELVSLKR